VRRTVQRDLKRLAELELITESGRGPTDPGVPVEPAEAVRSCDKL
jgi:hypothetical protein